ncbi:MAG TPA: hypothetical protein VIK41_06275 [Gemmatimonadaceae bacterium]
MSTPQAAPALTNRPTRTRGQAWVWVMALGLALPAFAPLVGHYVGFIRAGLHPTGFLAYDMPYYMANAREHFDAGGFSLLYGSPFTYDYGTPRIYFQPLTLLLGLFGRLPGADPGVVLALVGLIAAVVCVRIGIALFDRFASRATPSGKLALVVFFWGGGAVVLLGMLFVILPGPAGTKLAEPPSLSGYWWFTGLADPAAGWWFLNFGRNFVYATEAVYHALFLGAALLIIRRRFAAALGVMAVLAASHPFTGLQFLLIALAWSALELVVLRSRVVPWWFVAGSAVLVALHVWYYLVYLPSFPEHRQLQEQWTIRWTISVAQTIIAYGIVGGCAWARLRPAARPRTVLNEFPNRLLLVWLFVSLALENHELFLPRAIQPIHFTRGYSWIALFLLGLPALISAIDHVRENTHVRWRVLAVAGFGLVLVLDNVVWLGATTAQAMGIQLGKPLPPDSVKLGYGLSTDERALFDWMNRPENRGSVVVSQDDDVGYLLTTYTPLRSWFSHRVNTPRNMQRYEEIGRFFESGAITDAWRELPLVIVFRDSTAWRQRTSGFAPAPVEPVYTNRGYTVVRVRPPPAAH